MVNSAENFTFSILAKFCSIIALNAALRNANAEC